MKYSQFRALCLDANEIKNFDLYVAERGWQAWMDEYADGNDASKILKVLTTIYNIADMSPAGLRKELNMSRISFCRRFDLSLRTVENWDAGDRTPPPSLLNFLRFVVFIELMEGNSEDHE